MVDSECGITGQEVRINPGSRLFRYAFRHAKKWEKPEDIYIWILGEQEVAGSQDQSWEFWSSEVVSLITIAKKVLVTIALILYSWLSAFRNNSIFILWKMHQRVRVIIILVGQDGHSISSQSSFVHVIDKQITASQATIWQKPGYGSWQIFIERILAKDSYISSSDVRKHVLVDCVNWMFDQRMKQMPLSEMNFRFRTRCSDRREKSRGRH